MQPRKMKRLCAGLEVSLLLPKSGSILTGKKEGVVIVVVLIIIIVVIILTTTIILV